MAFQIPEDNSVPTSKEQVEQWAAEKEKLLKLEAGYDMDRLILEKVYGIVGPTTLSFRSSRNIENSVFAAEKAGLFDNLNVLLGKDSDGNWAVIEQGQAYTTLIASAKELPLALCRAILSVIFDREHPIIRPTVTFIEPMTGNPFSKG